MSDKQIPAAWLIDPKWQPEDHLMKLRGNTEYLNVQNRLLWFIRDQRDFIVRGLATTSYCIRTELVEQDRDAGYAHFKTYVRDVLGNEAVMYGSESAKDFADYAEKASTKSLGRALLALGYGTAFAPEMDEGDRIVDTPVERKREQQQPAQQSNFASHPHPIHAPADKRQQQQQQERLRQQNDAELAEQPWPYLQDAEFRAAMNKRQIRDREGISAFVATAANKTIGEVTYADRDICIAAATSLEGLAGTR